MFGRPPKKPTGIISKVTAKLPKKGEKQPLESERSTGSRTTQPRADDSPKIRALELGEEYALLLRTNLSPTDDQRTSMQALQTALAAQVTSFDQMATSKTEQIANLELAITQLRGEVLEFRQQAALARKNAASVRSLLAPIRVLPPEIMGEIFLACLDARVFARTSAAPLLLCRICSPWRTIALSTPALWSSLTIYKPMAFNSIFQLTSRWFGLAGEVPLSLGFHAAVYHTTSDNVPDTWRRVSRLEIKSNTPAEAMLVMRAIRTASPPIEHLSLRFGFIGAAIKELGKLLPFFSSLRELTIADELSISSRPSFFQDLSGMVWGNLTHVSLSELALDPFVWKSSFQNCASLQHGSFLLYEADPSTVEFRSKMVSLPALLTLKITFKHLGDWAILKGLSFPSLQSLALGSLEGLGVWNVPALMGIQAGRGALEALALFRVKVKPADLIDFLRSTPTVKHLLLDIPLNYASLIKQLSIVGVIQTDDSIGQDKSAPEVLLPKLSKLSSYQWRETNGRVALGVKAFRTMVAARWSPPTKRDTAPPGKCLASVCIYTSQVNSTIDILRKILAPLREDGLALHIGVGREGFQLKFESDW